MYDLELPENCPKANAKESDTLVFRCVKSNPPTADDLKTYFELELAGNDECKRRAISLYETLEQARHRIELSPALANHVASAKLTKAHGMISQPSNTGHMSWWPYAGMRNPGEFEVVSE